MLSVRYITSELEEMEREDNFRLKRFKELKTKKNKDKDRKDYRCYCDKKPGQGDDFVCAVCKMEEDKRKVSKNVVYKNISKSLDSEVMGDKPSTLSTANQKRLDDLTAHLGIVISLTNQCKTEGLMSPSADTFVYACKEVRCKLEEIEQPQNTCQTNVAAASQVVCCDVCGDNKGEQNTENVYNANDKQVNQDGSSNIADDKKPEVVTYKVSDKTNIVQTQEIPCKTCNDPQDVKPEDGNLLGYFETKYKEIVKVVKIRNDDGTISEEKQVITIKTERKHPHNPNGSAGFPCCKIDSFDSGYEVHGNKSVKTCCKDVRTAKSQVIPSSKQDQQTKARLCVSDTKNNTKDNSKVVKECCTVCDTGTEPKTSVSFIVGLLKKCLSENKNNDTKERKKSNKKICCNKETTIESSNTDISEKSNKNVCCNEKCLAQTGSIKSKISEKSIENICCNEQCVSKTSSSKSKLSIKFSRVLCCNQERPSQTSSIQSKLSDRPSKNVCCNQKFASQMDNFKSKTFENSAKEFNKKSSLTVCCNKSCSLETEIDKSKASEISSNKSIKIAKSKTSTKDVSCSYAAPTRSAGCDVMWKDESSSTTDLAEITEETEEKCICIQDAETVEPEDKAESKFCYKKDDKVEKKKSIFNFKLCSKSKNKFKETVRCPQCNAENRIQPSFEQCPYCFAKNEDNSRSETSSYSTLQSKEIESVSEECPFCAAKTESKTLLVRCPYCGAKSTNENEVQLDAENCKQINKQPSYEKYPKVAEKQENKTQPNSEQCPKCNPKVELKQSKDKHNAVKCPHCSITDKVKLHPAECPFCAAKSNKNRNPEKCPECNVQIEPKRSCDKCPHCAVKTIEDKDETKIASNKCLHCNRKSEAKPSSGKCPHSAEKRNIKPSSGKCAHCTAKYENDMLKEKDTSGKCPHCAPKTESKQSFRKCFQSNSKNKNVNMKTKANLEKCSHCASISNANSRSEKCSHCASKIETKPSSKKCSHCGIKNQNKLSPGKCSHFTPKSENYDNKEKDVSGNCPHCAAVVEVKTSSEECPNCFPKSKNLKSLSLSKCSQCKGNNDMKNTEVKEEPCCKIRIISKQKDKTDNQDTVQEFIFPGNILQALRKILQPTQSQENTIKVTDIDGTSGTQASCSCSTLPKSPPPKIQSCSFCEKNDTKSTSYTRPRSQSLGNVCCQKNSNQISLEMGRDSCPSCKEKTVPFSAACKCLESSALNSSKNKEKVEDYCGCTSSKGLQVNDTPQKCLVCEAQRKAYKHNDLETKCPRTILKNSQSCPLCDENDQNVSNSKQSKSKDSCCFVSKVKLCCDSDEEVTKVDASTSTRRSDRYDVRPLRLMKSQKKLTCTCQSDSILLRNTRAQDPKRCRSCMSYHNYCT